MLNKIPGFYIYRITNLINNKVYIGQTGNLSQRWSQYKYVAKIKDDSYVINKALIKYNVDNFIFEHIASCKNQEDLDETEILLIQQYDCLSNNGKGYNVALGGNKYNQTEESKAKLSKSLKEYYQYNVSKLKGIPLTEEHKKKVSISLLGLNTGQKRSDECKVKMSDAKVKYIIDFSEEVKKEICQLYIEGMPISELAKKYKRFAEQISQMLKQEGINKSNQKRKKTQLSLEQESQICIKYDQYKPTLTSLSKKFGCSHHTIRNILIRNNRYKGK